MNNRQDGDLRLQGSLTKQGVRAKFVRRAMRASLTHTQERGNFLLPPALNSKEGQRHLQGRLSWFHY